MRVVLIASTVVRNNIPGYVDHELGPLDGITDLDDLSEQAGRLCYLSWDRPNTITDRNHTYLANIIKQGHFSVMEHGSVTFYIDGITRNFSHELIRHRHLSYSELSQRYVDAHDIPFIEHPDLSLIDDETHKKLDEALIATLAAYGMVVEDLTKKHLERKKARQAARQALMSGTETRILVTGNMRAWRDMLPKRLSPAADTEFQQVAREVLAQLRWVAPSSFQDFDYPDL